MSTPAITPDNDTAAAFIKRWRKSGGAERANYQMFIAELCALLGVEPPRPAVVDDRQNTYTFDRAVVHTRPDGTETTNYIDCYKQGCFVLETKQGVEKRAAEQGIKLEWSAPVRKKGHGVRGTASYNTAMEKAYNQAERYVRGLPVSEGAPPFLLVVDIGYSFEIRADFSRSRRTYIPFPDPQSFRIYLTDLAQEDVRERLRLIFTDPMALDPSRHAARVTREVARHLAELSKSLEEQGIEAHRTARFLMRCIFTMFAEDVELIPKDGFRNLLKAFTRHTPEDQRLSADAFPELVRDIWKAMDAGTFSVHLKQKLQRFNGGLFQDTEVLPLTEAQITMLHSAAACEWRDVEPAIFGTLLERALNSKERHKLGAHYTPRAYVERLVLPTVIEPLREDWSAVKVAALREFQTGDREKAISLCRSFLHNLTQTLVLDPACGTGNFLYVTLDHMKRLEGEVRDELAKYEGAAIGEFEASEFQVDPHQFLGIEVNPRAAAIADLVLWIGYLQWQIKALGTTRLPEPVLRRYGNIEQRDAVLDYTATRPRLGEHGEPVTRWDGETTKLHPVTGQEVPDETARVPVLDYLNTRPAEWPFAHFIVGNPPFLGTARMRAALGDGYAEALRRVYPDVPESADFVMYWWHKAARYLRFKPPYIHVPSLQVTAQKQEDGSIRSYPSYIQTRHLAPGSLIPVLRRFGFITTNSLRQTFNRRVLQHHMDAEDNPISLAFAIPDHPWVEASDGAAVRIAMTVAQSGKEAGVLQVVESETNTVGGRVSDTAPEIAEVTFSQQVGVIHPDLTLGADVAGAVSLKANEGLANRGMQLIGAGFILNESEAESLKSSSATDTGNVIRAYLNGRDITGSPRNAYAIDFFGLTEHEARERYPAIYQWIYERVKPDRDVNKRASYKRNWWIHGEPRRELRTALAGLPRYIATVETSKHRFFVFLDAAILPDNMLVNIALSDAYYLGVLSSRFHVYWALALGGTLEDRPRYNKSRCFDTFPFPTPAPEQSQRIRDVAERLDGHRKRQQALHPGLTLTDCYNVLEKLRASEALTAKDKRVHEEGLVTVLLQLHDDMDAAVADAYGWPTDLSDEEILQRLVDLNRERAEEEAQGLVRWLRPEYQNPASAKQPAAQQDDLLPEPPAEKPTKSAKSKNPAKTPAKSKPAKTEKQPWPKTLPEQAKAVQAILREQENISAAEIAARFKRVRVEAVEPIMQTLAALGQG